MLVRHISLTQHLCSRRYLTLCKILYPLDLRWPSYKLLLWDKLKAPLHLLETISFRGLSPWGWPALTSDWQHSFSVFPSLQIPSVCSLFRANCSCKLVQSSIDFRSGSSHCCQLVSLHSTHYATYRKPNPSGTPADGRRKKKVSMTSALVVTLFEQTL